MFEFIIYCVISLALAYWAVLWVMGRREDVLHGEFVEGKLQPDKPVRSVFPTQPVPVSFPEQPARAALPEQPAFQPERLAALLDSIKRDLDPLVPKK